MLTQDRSIASRVRTIESVKSPVGSRANGRRRVCAYCRVSTDHDAQETSFAAQQRHFKSLIRENPSWELVGIYADEESGTRTAKRDNFMRMIADCEAGLIDMVLTKSISRFARNTVDCLNYIRRLKAMGIPILFTKENINTMDAGGEVLVTIMASIAQQESASISQNVQMGVRYRYREGKVCSGVHNLLGYERTPSGSLAIVPAEADVVRRIFRDYLDGYSPSHIAELLTRDGIDGAKVTTKGVRIERAWNGKSIEYLLQNEKYAGDLLLQKYYTVDYLTKKTAPNAGQLPRYFVANNHEPIVPKDIFLQTQAEMVRRRQHWQQFRHSHSCALAGRLICGCCGAPYRRRSRTGVARWVCETKSHRERHPDACCTNISIAEDVVHEAVGEAFARLPLLQDELERMERQLMTALDQWAAAEDQRAACVDELLQVRNLLDRIVMAKSWQEADDCTAETAGGHEEEGSDYCGVGAGVSGNPVTGTLDGPVAEGASGCLGASSNRAAGTADDRMMGTARSGVFDSANGRAGRAADGSHGRLSQGACSDARQFFALTQPAYHGSGYNEDDVCRYVTAIVRESDALTVEFKAGVSIRIPLNDQHALN